MLVALDGLEIVWNTRQAKHKKRIYLIVLTVNLTLSLAAILQSSNYFKIMPRNNGLTIDVT